jgi:hypothetical protein
MKSIRTCKLKKLELAGCKTGCLKSYEQATESRPVKNWQKSSACVWNNAVNLLPYAMNCAENRYILIPLVAPLRGVESQCTYWWADEAQTGHTVQSIIFSLVTLGYRGGHTQLPTWGNLFFWSMRWVRLCLNCFTNVSPHGSICGDHLIYKSINI